MPSKYYIKTYGCQMNENDSEIIAGVLESKGYKKTGLPEDADIIITNTCSVRDGAERKAKGFIADLVHLKKKNKGLLIGVVGCMAERMGDELLKKYRFVDFVLGPNMEMDIANIVRGRSRATRTGDSRDFKDSSLAKRENAVNAWITIMEGCDNFCSYCIVPYVRGREKSRPVADILREIECLDKDIFKEVTLLGQNVNSYEFGLAKLLKEVSRIDGIRRIKFMTSHPRDMSDEIIDAVAGSEKVCEFFHLPLQSGSDAVLKAMNRGYDMAYYSSLVKKIREKIPSASITSDVIAGFPGETDEQFSDTLKNIEMLGFDAVNTLAFDPRPGTKAAGMHGQLPKDTISKRLQALMRTVERVTHKKNQSLLGSEHEILVETAGIGRTRTNKIIKFNNKSIKPGSFVRVKIISAKSWVLQAELLD